MEQKREFFVLRNSILMSNLDRIFQKETSWLERMSAREVVMIGPSLCIWS